MLCSTFDVLPLRMLVPFIFTHPLCPLFFSLSLFIFFWLSWIVWQMLPRGRYRYPGARGLPDAAIPGVTGGVLPGVQYDMGGIQMREAALTPTVPVGTLATLLANATPDQQRLVGVFFHRSLTLMSQYSQCYIVAAVFLSF